MEEWFLSLFSSAPKFLCMSRALEKSFTVSQIMYHENEPTMEIDLHANGEDPGSICRQLFHVHSIDDGG